MTRIATSSIILNPRDLYTIRCNGSSFSVGLETLLKFPDSRLTRQLLAASSKRVIRLQISKGTAKLLYQYLILPGGLDFDLGKATDGQIAELCRASKDLELFGLSYLADMLRVKRESAARVKQQARAFLRDLLISAMPTVQKHLAKSLAHLTGGDDDDDDCSCDDDSVDVDVSPPCFVQGRPSVCTMFARSSQAAVTAAMPTPVPVQTSFKPVCGLGAMDAKCIAKLFKGSTMANGPCVSSPRETTAVPVPIPSPAVVPVDVPPMDRLKPVAILTPLKQESIVIAEDVVKMFQNFVENMKGGRCSLDHAELVRVAESITAWLRRQEETLPDGPEKAHLKMMLSLSPMFLGYLRGLAPSAVPTARENGESKAQPFDLNSIIGSFAPVGGVPVDALVSLLRSALPRPSVNPDNKATDTKICPPTRPVVPPSGISSAIAAAALASRAAVPAAVPAVVPATVPAAVPAELAMPPLEKCTSVAPSITDAISDDDDDDCCKVCASSQ